MNISIIITTKNEEKQLPNCLDSIAIQDYPKAKREVIVVDNASLDKTKEIALQWGAIVFDYGPERSAQRNFGISQARGEYILYLDADMRLTPKVLSECMEKCTKGYVGLYIPEKIIGEGFWVKVRDFERSFYNTTSIDAVRFVKRDIFLKIGGFDVSFNEGEDWDLNRRVCAAGKVSSIVSPLLHDESNIRLGSYLSKKGHYSKNLYRYIKKWGANDPIIKQQTGIYYRFFGVFIENGKFMRLFRHPFLALSMYFLRFCVGISYLLNKRQTL